MLQDIEQVIHQYLKSQNYQRILFYSGVKKLYFLDAESRDRTRIPSSSNPKSIPTENPEKPMQVTPGPLGKRRRLLGKKMKVGAKLGKPSLMQNQQLMPQMLRPLQETQ